jgi:hypothetical protein
MVQERNLPILDSEIEMPYEPENISILNGEKKEK